MTSNPLNPSNGDENPKDPLAEMLQNLMGGKGMGEHRPRRTGQGRRAPG